MLAASAGRLATRCCGESGWYARTVTWLIVGTKSEKTLENPGVMVVEKLDWVRFLVRFLKTHFAAQHKKNVCVCGQFLQTFIKIYTTSHIA